MRSTLAGTPVARRVASRSVPDPVADKLLVVTTLVALTASTPGVARARTSKLIVAREVSQCPVLRSFCALATAP